MFSLHCAGRARTESPPLSGGRNWAFGGVGEQYVGASWPAALALDSASVRLDNADKQIPLLARQNAPLPRQRFRGVVLSQLEIRATCWAP